jgi:sarcosine oxidase, subunit beta
MQTADVVIVGRGIVGCSIAYHPAASGCRSLLVIERESAQGKGFSGKRMGGVRAQFSTPVGIPMSLHSIPSTPDLKRTWAVPVTIGRKATCFAPQRTNRWLILRANYTLQVKTGL